MDDTTCTETTPEAIPADLRNDRVTGRSWLAFATKPPDAVCAALGELGWRFSGLRREWNHPRRHAPLPGCVKATHLGLVDYNAERADMLRERAGKREAAGAEKVAQARQTASLIPFGQPILVGHHSEGKHRRDAARIESGFSQGYALQAEAGGLRQRAEGSEARQARHDDPRTARRRMERLQKELAKPWLSESVRADLQRQVEDTRAAAEAPLPSDTLQPKPGDLAKVKGSLVLILKVNAKTLQGVVARGGAKGHEGTWPRMELQAIFSSGNPLPFYRAGGMPTGAMEYCPHQHATRREANACGESLWPKLGPAYRCASLVMPDEK